VDIAEALRVRLAAAGLEPPADARARERMERDLAVHLERVAAVAEAQALLGPDDPPHTDPTRAADPARP
jgi:hypothetical protein